MLPLPSRHRVLRALKRSLALTVVVSGMSFGCLTLYDDVGPHSSMHDGRALYRYALQWGYSDNYGSWGSPRPLGFPKSEERLAQAIYDLDGNVVMHTAPSVGKAVSFLRHHSGVVDQGGYTVDDNTFFITSLGHDHLTLVGRAGHGPIVELSGDYKGVTSTKTLWQGYTDPSFMLPLTAVEFGPLLLLFLLGAALGERRELGKQERWRTLVPVAGGWGPDERQDDFTLLGAVCREHASEPWLQTIVYRWDESWGCWREDKQGEETKTFTNPDGTSSEKVWRAGTWQDPEALPKSLVAQRVAPDEAATTVSERWFEYVRAVADWNSSRWRKRQEQEARLEEAKSLRALTQGKDLSQLLQPADELMQGLSLGAE